MNWHEIQIAIMTLAANATQFATNWLIQSTLLIAFGILLAKLLQNRGAAVQSLVYRTTLAAVLICPVTTWALSCVGVSGWSISIEPGFTYERATTAQVDLAPLITESEPAAQVTSEARDLVAQTNAMPPLAMEQPASFAAAPATGAQNPSAAFLPTEQSIQSTTTVAAEMWIFDVTWFGLLSPAILAGWLLITVYFLSRLTASWWRMSNLVRRAHVADQATMELCQTLAGQLDVATPGVLRSPFISSPCLVGLGLIKPANVLLPAEDVDLPMRDVLVHELAHLRRHDCHWNLLRQLATSVYFFQPLLWVLSRQIEITAEEVCDDIVVHSGGNREDYAHRLVDIAELSTELSAAAVAAAGVGIVSLRSMLARRVERILDTNRSLSTRVGNLLMVAVLLGGIAGTAVVGFVGLNESKIVADEQTADGTGETLRSKEAEATEKMAARSYSGKVVDPDGNPVAGADVFLDFYLPEPTGLFRNDWKPLATSGKDGKFQFDFAPGDYGLEASVYEPKYNSILAVKDGFGFATVKSSVLEDQDNGATITLAPDHPIKGRITDINGQPVEGARLTVFRIYSNDKNDLSDWNKEAKTPGSDFYKARTHVSSISAGPALRSAVSPAVTNGMGEFVLTGAGKGRIVRLLLEGDGIETQKIRVRTELGETIKLHRESRSSNLGKWTYYPSDFQHICGPSIPVTGVVRDKATGKPIAGATIVSQALHGERISGSGSDFIRAVSDADGRYRLTGLPMGSDNRIGVIVPIGETAYPSYSKKADTSVAAGDEDGREVNFDMTPGVWLHGRVVDAGTGKGLTGVVKYFADRSNPNSQLLRRGVDERDRRTDSNGEVSIPIFPGKGYVAFMAAKASEYPRASTIVKQDGSEEAAPQIMDTNPHSLVPNNHNFVAQIHPAKDAKEYEVNLSLNAGETLAGKVVGPDMKPVSGFHYFGDVSSFSSWKQVEGDGFLLKGCREGVLREVYVVDPKTNMSGYASILGIPDQTPQIQLAPAGNVTGRVVDEDGQPLAFRTMFPLNRRVPDAGEMAKTTRVQPPLFAKNNPRRRFRTDAEGRFEFSCLLANAEYRLNIIPKDDPPYSQPLDVVIKVKGRESKDLGDVRVSDDPNLFDDVVKQIDTKAKKGAVVQKDTGVKLAAKQKHDSLSTFVVLPNGKPAANTHVAIIGYDGDSEKPVAFVNGMTDKDGKCKLVGDPAMLIGESDNPRTIIARRDGFGVGWKHLSTVASEQPIQIQLHHERIIEGKLIDIEGEPAARETLQIGFIVDPSIKPATMDAWATFHSPKSLDAPEAWLKPVTTDDKGWFRLTGVPKDHGVHMTLVDSERFAPQDILLNTGESEQRGERDGTYRSLVKNVEPDEEAILTLSPAKVITGTITYEDTGEPVPNGKVAVWASQQKFGSMVTVTCQTDADGKYRILPKPGIRFGVTAYPPGGVPYMARKAKQLEWENSDLNREVDIKLPRVVLVRGRVLEAGTDKPVANAKITFEEGDKSSKMPENVITGWQAAQKTDADGNFTFAVPPGRGTLLIRKFGGNYVMKHRMSRQIRLGLPGGERVYAHALELLQTKPGDDAVDVEIRLTLGQKTSGEIVDNEGKLVDKAYIVTSLKVWDSSGRWRGGSNENIGGKFELLGLDSDNEYPVHFLDPQRKLGATASLRGGQKNVKVELQPCGKAQAKFILDDPDRKFYPTLYFVASPGVGKYDHAKWKLGLVAADSDFNTNVDRINYRLPSEKRVPDADGYFTFPALIPGATYRLITRENGDWDYKDFSVKSGETLDLGEFTPKFDD